MGNSSREFRWY